MAEPRPSTGSSGTDSAAVSAGGHSARSVLARLDRLDAWSMPFLFVGIIGTGFLFWAIARLTHGLLVDPKIR